MSDRVPLSTLLSQVLIAFTIELDNESERRFTAAGRRRMFLVSLVMWSNLMRFVDEQGVRIAEIPDRAGVPGTPATAGWIQGVLAGMQRWGYISIAPDPADDRPKPPRLDLIVHATAAGRKAQAVWQPLTGEIETRWRERFGAREVEGLRDSLRVLVGGFDVDLPRYLPVMSYADGMRAPVPHLEGWWSRKRSKGGSAVDVDLSALLSQVLLLFTVEFERESNLSLAISSNALRVLGNGETRVRDLPSLTGVSKEAIGVSLTFLDRRGYLTVEPYPSASRVKVARLTPKGRAAFDAYVGLLGTVEEAWRARFGRVAIDRLRAALDLILDRSDDEGPIVSRGLAPHPDGWRAHRPYAAQTEAVVGDPRGSLPHFPMVLHRGGWPDGS